MTVSDVVVVVIFWVILCALMGPVPATAAAIAAAGVGLYLKNKTDEEDE